MATADRYYEGPPSNPPRHVAAYERCDHYDDRVSDPRRPITHERADEAIRNGRVEFNPADRPHSWRFMLNKSGCDIAVAVGKDREPGRDRLIRITGYVDVTDFEQATRAGKWKHEDVHVAALLQYLVGQIDDRNGGVDESMPHPKHIDVTEPVDYRGHRIIKKSGFYRALCVDCYAKSAHKTGFEGRPCR